MPDLLTTGQAADFCAVAPRTVARWVDAGLIRAHRTAGGRRRMRRSDLLEFMRKRGMPIAPSHQPRIALVDDDPRIIQVLTRQLASIVPEAECRSAPDGFLAGVLVCSFRPHLVFLDVDMPGMSGLQVCRDIRATPELARTAIVIISGVLTEPLRAELREAGADRLVAKPFKRAPIEAAVADFLLPARLAAGATDV